ncbi:hypothetical protein AJ78_09050, partial [Emergomyces pasteurianus Ep9510]
NIINKCLRPGGRMGNAATRQRLGVGTQGVRVRNPQGLHYIRNQASQFLK